MLDILCSVVESSHSVLPLAGSAGSAELPDNVAGAEGEEEIVEKFKECIV